MFKAPKQKPPTITPPPPVPTVDAARERADEEFRRLRRRGRAAYVMAGRSPRQSPVVGGKTLTGS
jgi:hypothetical protein